MKPQYETLQSIVDQLALCEYQTKDGLHDLKNNAAFVALSERASAEREQLNRPTSGIAAREQPNMPTCGIAIW